MFSWFVSSKRETREVFGDGDINGMRRNPMQQNSVNSGELTPAPDVSGNSPDQR